MVRSFSLAGALRFNPRSLHRERRGSRRGSNDGRVSIHAPYIGSDLQSKLQATQNPVFQSTLPT